MNKVVQKIMARKDIVEPSSSQNSWWIFDKKGRVLKYAKDQPCFGSIAFLDKYPRPAGYLVGTCRYLEHGGRRLKDSQIAEYTDFLFHRSQYASVLEHCNTVEWSMAKKGLIVPANMPSPFVITIAQTYRLAWSYSGNIRAWFALRKHIPEIPALYAAMYFIGMSNSYGDTPIEELRYSPPRNEHYPIDLTYGCSEQVRFWIDGEAKDPDRWPIFAEEPNYRGIDELYSNYQGHLGSFLAPSHVANQQKNPFIRPRPKSSLPPVQEWLKINKLEELIPWKK